ncbi:putative transcription factor C2H2 family [Medicago truncatula]|uniref:Putative transcription factor C2H2 family n=1 Tax=Medicago truncatula TaxID=3880 RepID=A0A072UN21_MEDTR|nr:uncharacterized protein LOC11413365 isoform X2 [Medicago truncatula]KEH31199.1 TB2/DP1, HVA22 family protein [Medicago truncatula]RHN62646.1 putative transcription factor C2H2 family [Medicago truncatula]
MASSFLLKLVFKSLHHFAWCASIQAIETDSDAEIKNIISYWILLSLIYLFEYAFMSLLLWFHLWPYIKLMIIFCLIIPDFGRASYVYNNLIRPMKLQIVSWRLNNYWRKCFVEKDDFLMHAERYMQENGTEALEKLIASKNTMCRPEVTNEIIATDNKEMLKSNAERLQIEHKDIKDSDAVEKKVLPAFKQDIPVLPKIGPSQNASLATVETNVTAERNSAGGEVPQSSTSTQKEVQKEWTCALCLVTTTSEKILNSHLSGKKHRAALQRQKDAETNGERILTEHKIIKDLDAVEKKEIHETKQDIPVIPKIGPSQNESSASVETKGTVEGDRAGGEVPQSSSMQMDLQKDRTCDLCLTTAEEILNARFSGRKHSAALQKQKDAEAINEITTTDNKEILKGTNGDRLQTEHKDIKDLEAIEEKEIPATKQDILMPKIWPSQMHRQPQWKPMEQQSDTVGVEVPQSSTIAQKEVQKEWACALCLVTVPCEKTLNSHLNGRKHRAACEAALKAKKLKIYKAKEEVKQENFSNKLNSDVENGGGIVNNRLKGPVRMQKLHFIGPTPSPQALSGPTPFGGPTSSPIRVPFSYHRGPTPFRGPAPFGGPTPPPIRVPFSYHGSDGSWARQPEFTYFIPTPPRLPPLEPNSR